MLLKKAKHLTGVDSIEIYKYLEIMPIHDVKEMRDWMKRVKKKVKETLSNDDPRIGCVNYPIRVYFKSHLTNDSWLKKHVVLGLRIREFINTEDSEIAVKTIKEYRDVLLYEGEEILICLLVIMSLNEYQKFRSKLKKRGKPLWLPLFNPFKQELLRWRFLAKWGDYQEQKKAKGYLRRANIESFMETSAGRPRGSGRFNIDKGVKTTYKKILAYLQKRFKTIDPMVFSERVKVVKQCIEENDLLEQLAPSIFSSGGYSHEDEKEIIAKSLVHFFPYRPSSIALQIISAIHGIKESYLHDLLFRKKLLVD